MEGEHVNPLNLTSTEVTGPTQSWPQGLHLYRSAPTLGVTVFGREGRAGSCRLGNPTKQGGDRHQGPAGDIGARCQGLKLTFSFFLSF